MGNEKITGGSVKIITRQVLGFNLKGTKKQLEELKRHLNYEDYYTPDFRKYFIVDISQVGVVFYPKYRYFGGGSYAEYLEELKHYNLQGRT